MLTRLLAVLGSVVYVFVAIGVVAYFGVSHLWLAPLLAPAIYFIFRLPDIAALPPVPPQKPAPISAEWQAKIDARLGELKAGPPHRNQARFVDAISRGIPYSDDRIDYQVLPDRLVLCEHLRPLEAAMRASGIPMDHHAKRIVEVQCLLHVERIRQRYSLADCVEFGLGAGVDNHAPPINVIRCKRCGDSIEEQGMFGGPWPPV